MNNKFKIVPLGVCVGISLVCSINTYAILKEDSNLDGYINILDILESKHSVLYESQGIEDYSDIKKVILGIENSTTIDENLGTYVLTSNLNFREYAGTEYQSYEVVENHTLIEVIETAYSSDGILWGKYIHNNKVGWSSLKYATKLQSIGTTSNGFEILQGNGLTFINGILIVNKTYSLPSDYAPVNATLTADTSNAFNTMKADASKLGLNLYVSSGYRSYEYQKNLYQRYVNADGQAKADTYSARAGHSEHQTGLCFDLNTISDSFASTKEGIWVAENCHKYGFIIRYPKGKNSITGYKYEPWHLRYVGVELATLLYNNNLTIEEYFGITSQYE